MTVIEDFEEKYPDKIKNNNFTEAEKDLYQLVKYMDKESFINYLYNLIHWVYIYTLIYMFMEYDKQKSTSIDPLETRQGIVSDLIKTLETDNYYDGYIDMLLSKQKQLISSAYSDTSLIISCILDTKLENEKDFYNYGKEKIYEEFDLNKMKDEFYYDYLLKKYAHNDKVKKELGLL